jgi:hypothetical protein
MNLFARNLENPTAGGKTTGPGCGPGGEGLNRRQQRKQRIPDPLFPLLPPVQIPNPLLPPVQTFEISPLRFEE